MRPKLDVRLIDSNAVVNFEADHVIVADGKGAWPGTAPPPTGDFGIKAHFPGIEARGIRSSCSAATDSTAAWPPSRAAAGTRHSVCPLSGSEAHRRERRDALAEVVGGSDSFPPANVAERDKLEIGWLPPCRDSR